MQIEIPRRRPLAIRLTPLIDVVFILLVFFMLASSFLDWRAFDLALPPVGATPDPEIHPIVIRIDATGDLSIAGEAVAAQALAGRIETLRRADPERPVVLRAASDTPVHMTVRTLDRLRAGNIRAVSLAAQPE